jgi:hypothetical protein
VREGVVLALVRRYQPGTSFATDETLRQVAEVYPQATATALRKMAGKCGQWVGMGAKVPRPRDAATATELVISGRCSKRVRNKRV